MSRPAAKDEGAARQARTRRTRAAVVEAARGLFLERGYSATTIEAISDRSDTPQPTVYRLFSSKLGILKSLLDVSIGGDDQAVAMLDRPKVRALLSAEDPKTPSSRVLRASPRGDGPSWARSPHPRRRGQVRPRRRFTARRDRSPASRGAAPDRTLTRSFRRAAARAPRARSLRHRPRPCISGGLRLARTRPGLERRAVREMAEVNPHRPASLVDTCRFKSRSYEDPGRTIVLGRLRPGVDGHAKATDRRLCARLSTDTFAQLAARPALGYGPTRAGRPYFYAVAPRGRSRPDPRGQGRASQAGRTLAVPRGRSTWSASALTAAGTGYVFGRPRKTAVTTG